MNAEEARKISIKGNTKVTERKFKEIVNQIEREASKGRRKLILDYFISDQLKEIFVELGYAVEYIRFTEYYSEFTEIKW